MEKEDERCTCDECKGGEEHTCPYQEDINGNYEPYCTCCLLCERQCAMDI